MWWNVLEVVPQPRETDRIRLLSWIEVEDAEGTSHIFRVVGADETDAKQRWISWRSPVGRALLGKAVDDEVVVETPGGRMEYVVLEIYSSAPD